MNQEFLEKQENFIPKIYSQRGKLILFGTASFQLLWCLLMAWYGNPGCFIHLIIFVCPGYYQFWKAINLRHSIYYRNFYVRILEKIFGI